MNKIGCEGYLRLLKKITDPRLFICSSDLKQREKEKDKKDRPKRPEGKRALPILALKLNTGFVLMRQQESIYSWLGEEAFPLCQ